MTTTKIHKIIIFYSLVLWLNASINQSQTAVGQNIHQRNSGSTAQENPMNRNDEKQEIKRFEMKSFFEEITSVFTQTKDVLADLFELIILRRRVRSTSKEPVAYKENFASVEAGAQILWVSSNKIASPKSILKGEPDTYMFTQDILPITIVIGLKEEILIDSFEILSVEAYSCIIKEFMLEGAFSLDNPEWVKLGNFSAEFSFKTQQFAVQSKTVRYLRLTILRSYGNWKYFTLTSFKVYGQSLFSHSVENFLKGQNNISSNSGDKCHESIETDFNGSALSLDSQQFRSFESILSSLLKDSIRKQEPKLQQRSSGNVQEQRMMSKIQKMEGKIQELQLVIQKQEADENSKLENQQSRKQLNVSSDDYFSGQTLLNLFLVLVIFAMGLEILRIRRQFTSLPNANNGAASQSNKAKRKAKSKID